MVQFSGICILSDFCHSTCDKCSIKKDPNQCTSCFSNFIVYELLEPNKTINQCKVKDQNYKLLMTIDSNTVISNSYVSSIRFKGQNYSTSGARVA